MNTNNIVIPAIETIKINLETIRKLKQEKEDITLDETAQIFLMDKFGFTQIQAEEIVEEIKKGISEYNKRLEELEDSQKDEKCLILSIEEATAGYSPEERSNIYVNVLTSLQLLNKNNEDTEIDALLAKNSSLSDEELIKAITLALDGLPFQLVMDNLKKGLTPEALELMSDAKEMRTKEFKLMAAIMLYAAQKEGTVSLPSENGFLSPRMIGAMASAASDSLASTCDLNQGNITLPVWQRFCKKILYAFFAVLFSLIAVVGTICFNLLLISIVSFVFGSGLITAILSLPIIYYATKFAINSFKEEHIDLQNDLSYVLDVIFITLNTVTERIIEKVKTWMYKHQQNTSEGYEKSQTNQQNTIENNNNSVDTEEIMA